MTSRSDIALIELGQFVRSRRERTPSVPENQPRKTPGLTREQAAEASNMGCDWYTRIEQGRARRPSTASLAAIGHAFALDTIEVSYMQRLLSASLSTPSTSKPSTVDSALHALLLKLADTPAYLLDERWRIVDYNRAAKILFTQLDHLSEPNNNCLWQHFCDKRFLASLDNRETVLAYVAALFRYSTSSAAAEPWRATLINRLSSESSVFATIWADQQVADWIASPKQFNHPEHGKLTFLNVSHAVSTMNGQLFRVVSYIPAEASDTESIIAEHLATHDSC